MDTRDLSKIDLNLLISLQILLEEGSVSRAAERLYITQPAMSKTLSRLRQVFNDELFTRSSHGMQPTPRALELGENLESILHDIKQLVSVSDFDPATYEGEFTIALSEFIGIGVLPLLMSRLQLLAPGLRLRTITRVEQQLDQLANGNLDLSIHLKLRNYSEEFLTHSLGGTAPVILAREAHPLSGQQLDWELLSQYPYISLYVSDLELLELVTAEDFRRAINSSHGGFETSHLLTALEVLRATDYLMPAPPFVLNNATAGYKIQALSFPSEIDYQLEYMLVRHKRTARSAVHNWLWQQLLEVFEELSERVRRAI